ncbi:MAG: hypothetical protein J0L82_15070 [Deltaproteobacteria bacterium]|nr:hypothetical protein [Deltaproteobacteria bacterium]
MRLDRHSISALSFILAAFIAICLLSPKVWSQTSNGDLLSYSELMRLPQGKRIAYIEGVRKILIELSKDPQARFSDSDPRARSKLKVWLEFLDQNLTREAKAATVQPCLQSKFCESALRSCFDQGQGIIWQQEVGTYRCNPAVKVGSKSQSAGSSVFARIDERAFLQYAERVSDPRGKTAADTALPKTQMPLTEAAIAASGANSGNAVIAIVSPVKSESSSPTSMLQTLGAVSRALRPGSQATNIQDYVELLAQGKIKGKRYSCRSKHQNQTFTNDSGKAIDHSGLSICTDEEEGKIQALFDRATAGELVFNSDTAQPEVEAVEAVPVVEAVRAPAPAAGNIQATAQLTGEENLATTFPLPPPAAPTLKFGRRINRVEIQPYLDERKSPDQICDKERKDLGDGKLVFVPMIDDGSFGRCMSEVNAKLFLAGGIERHPSDVSPPAPTAGKPAAGATAAEQSVVQSVVLTKFAACAPKPESCGDRAAIKKAYYQGKLPCVFAGMISNLDGQNKRCQAVREYKIGNENLTCEAGQAMCNPLLFGTVLGSSPTKAICVGRGQDVTSQCAKLSNARDAELFINRNANGLQEKWNEFKTSLESVCKSETVSAKFHCQECNTMKQRLFELHARLVGNPCGDTNLNQGINTRIKNRSRATEK